jgi:peptidoglycan/xylan/chitin deacetylase (PgdA/CDA1 family)
MGLVEEQQGGFQRIAMRRIPTKEKRMRMLKIAVLIVTACLSAAAQKQTSGLPALHTSGVAQPVGKPGGFKVLDWAGYKSALTYTFDDALPSQIENYAKLHATGVRMTFFLTSNNGVNPAWAQIAKDGNELGNHTAHHCHADATGCAWGGYAGSLEAEYDQCTAFIKKNYGVSEVWTTAAPYGDTGYEKVAKTRFFLNRGVMGGLVAPGDNTDPYNLLIHGAVAGETAAKINPAIDSSLASGKWLILMFHSMGGDNGYAPVDPGEVLASIHHAQSLQNVWIDSMVNVGAYWAGQKAVAEAKSSTSGKETILTWTLPPHFPPGHTLRVTVTGGVLKQDGKTLPWNDAGYYEIALDAGALTIGK